MGLGEWRTATGKFKNLIPVGAAQRGAIGKPPPTIYYLWLRPTIIDCR
jgi:hypothetical protein